MEDGSSSDDNTGRTVAIAAGSVAAGLGLAVMVGGTETATCSIQMLVFVLDAWYALALIPCKKKAARMFLVAEGCNVNLPLL